jgi:hypothetical protein
VSHATIANRAGINHIFFIHMPFRCKERRKIKGFSLKVKKAEILHFQSNVVGCIDHKKIVSCHGRFDKIPRNKDAMDLNKSAMPAPIKTMRTMARTIAKGKRATARITNHGQLI